MHQTWRVKWITGNPVLLYYTAPHLDIYNGFRFGISIKYK